MLYIYRVDKSWTESIPKTRMIQLTFSKNVLMFFPKLGTYPYRVKYWARSRWAMGPMDSSLELVGCLQREAQGAVRAMDENRTG